MIPKPASDAYGPGYGHYLSLVPEEELETALKKSHAEVLALVARVVPGKEDYRYAEGKWTVKEVLLHMADVERYLAFKAFVSARGDQDTVLYHPKWETYRLETHAGDRRLADVVAELEAVRTATITLFRCMDATQAGRITAHADAGHAMPASVIGFSIAGHTRHHLGVLEERYL